MHKELANNVMNCKNLAKYLRCLFHIRDNVIFFKVFDNLCLVL
jgi:hypothetical protein